MEKVAKRHDGRQERQKFTLVDLLFLPRAELVHPREQFVRHLAAAHVAEVGRGIGDHHAHALTPVAAVLSVGVYHQAGAGIRADGNAKRRLTKADVDELRKLLDEIVPEEDDENEEVADSENKKDQ